MASWRHGVSILRRMKRTAPLAAQGHMLATEMRPVGADRIAGIGTSIFTEITALAVKHEAVNLGQGFPDFPAPDFVKQAAARHIRDDRNQYAASAGVPRLRAALADDWRRLHPDARPIDPAGEITVGSGATEMLHDAVMAT